MDKRAMMRYLFLLFLSCILLSGCNNDSPAEDTGQQAKQETPKPKGPPRDNTPKVLAPSADGVTVYGNDFVSIDASNSSEGYVMVQYKGTNGKVKLQVIGPDQSEYVYLLSQGQEYETFPLPCGNGIYTFKVLENVEGDTYAVAFTQDIDAAVSDEFKPFLYPNQYVYFTADSQTVQKGSELAKDTYTDLEVVTNIYHYVTENITYDTEKAESVTYGYLPNADETLSTCKGICFDYTAVMTAMLRSQGIPTKLEIGYAGDVYHSWISTYVDDIGWVDNIIEFDGHSWQLMDPTLAANNDNDSVGKYIGDGTNYMLKNSY